MESGKFFLHTWVGDIMINYKFLACLLVFFMGCYSDMGFAENRQVPSGDPRMTFLQRQGTIDFSAHITGIFWSPNGKYLAVQTNFSHKLSILDAVSLQQNITNRHFDIKSAILAEIETPAPSNLNGSLAFLPDGESLVIPYRHYGMTNKGLTVWNFKTGKIRDIDGPFAGGDRQNRVAKIVISPDGNRLAATSSAAGNLPIVIYNTTDWSVEKVIYLDQFDGIDFRSRSFAFSNSSHILYVARPGSVFLAINIDTLEKLYETTSCRGGYRSEEILATSPDGRVVASALRNSVEAGRIAPQRGTICLYDAQNGQLLAYKGFGIYSMSELRWSSRDFTLAYESIDGSVGLSVFKDYENETPSSEKRHAANGRFLTWSPNGDYIFSSDQSKITLYILNRR